MSRDGELPAVDVAALYRHGLGADAREPRLRGVLLDTLASPGALTRLHLGLLAGKLLGLPGATARPLATALEYFHTASLLLDDLPAMDDARERRGRPCAHRAHGEAAAILGALAFINRAYALLWRALGDAPAQRRQSAARHVEHCLGVSGVLDGQSLDLHFGESDRSPQTAARAALGKTVSLLRLTLVTPALLAGADPAESRLLDRLAVYWGLAYQIADDFSDLAVAPETGKTPARDAARGRPNFVLVAGAVVATERLHRLLRLLQSTAEALVALRSGWQALTPHLERLHRAATAASGESFSALRCA